MRPVAALLLLAACSDRTLEGTVLGVDGTALPGVRVDLDPTRKHTRTDAEGRWSVHTRAGRYALTATLDDHLPATVHADVGDEGVFAAPTLRLIPLPPSDGIWLVQANAPTPLVRTSIERRTSERQRRYCLTADAGEGSILATGATSFVASHTRPWVLFPVDEDGCALTEEWETGRWRRASASPVDVGSEQHADTWLHTAQLDAGDYVLVPWSDERFPIDADATEQSGAKRYVAYRLTAR